MKIKELELIHFKNHTEQKLQFSEHINAIVGANGVGKTNILDAIFYLSITKSYFSGFDNQNIQDGEDFFLIQGHFSKKSEKYLITCSLKKNEPKKLVVNKKNADKFSNHIGQFPLVGIFPQDLQIIIGGSDERRKFIDSTISHYDPKYLSQLIRYNKTLAQRNSLLKNFAHSNQIDLELIAPYNDILAHSGGYIFEQRKAFIDEFIEFFRLNHSYIVNEKDKVDLIYSSHLKDDSLERLLESHLKKDIALQHTSVGIHRDDIQFSINHKPLKKFGSQGQQKCLLIALKLAQQNLFQQKLNITPILLIDDIFDKLDKERSTLLLQKLSDKDLGLQVILTHANKDFVEEVFQDIQISDVNMISI